MPDSNLLDKHRRRIDLIDQKLLTLLNDRARLAKDIGKLKARAGDDVFDSTREIEILSRLADLNKGPLPQEAVDDIFRTVFSSCRSLQTRLEVSYLGPEATFTQQVAIKHFGRNAAFSAVPSIRDVFFEV